MYLHEKENWSQFTIDYERICPLVASARHHQGRVLSQFLTAGVITSNKARLEAFVEEVSKSAEIEGEKFDPEHVRSSLCRRLGVDFPDDGRPVPRNVDGAVKVLQRFQCDHAGAKAILFPARSAWSFKWRSHGVD